MGNKSEAMSVLICSVTVCVTLSSIVQSGQKSSADLHVSRANKKEGGREGCSPPSSSLKGGTLRCEGGKWSRQAAAGAGAGAGAGGVDAMDGRVQLPGG